MEINSDDEVQKPVVTDTKEETESLKPAQNLILLDDKTQQIVAKDTAQLMRVIRLFMEGQAFPKTMDTPAKCIAAWNMAASFKNVSPQRAMARMMYINGTLAIWGELPKALAEATGELKDYELFLINAEHERICVENKNLNNDPYAAVCKIKRKGRTKNEYYFTVDEAERAGLLKKAGPWQQYAKIMLCWRAQGQALKFEFSDALMGAEIAEYTFNRFPSNPELKDVTPGEDKADLVNQRFSGS